MGSKFIERWPPYASAILCIAIFVADLCLPLGVAGGVPYIAPVLICSFSPHRNYIFYTAAAASLLVVLGYTQSVDGGAPWMVMTNRGLAIGAVWVTAVIVFLWKQTEHDLQLSEARHRDLIEDSDLGIQITGQDRGRIFANRACAQMFGYDSSGEVLAIPPQGMLVPVDREKSTKYREALFAGQPFPSTYEISGLRKDGTIFPLQVFMRRIVWDGQDAVQRTFIDLTRRKQAEQEIRELNRELEQRVEQRTAELMASEERSRTQFDHNPVPIFLWQRSGDDFIAIDRNEAATNLYGGAVRGRHPYAGKKAGDVLVRWPEGLRCMGQCYAEQRTIRHTGERPIVIPGETRWKDTTFVFIPPDRVMVHSQDVTEQKETETALREARETADHANTAKSRFLAVASHDLRQPLQALMLFSSLLENRLKEDTDREIVAKMDSSIDVMTDLLNTLLDISKLDAGTITPEIAEISVGDVMRSVATSLSSSVLESDVDFRTVTSAAIVRTDPVLIERVVQNLAANAIHHSGGRRVLVGCRRRGDKLRIEVWDNGKGIPEDERKHIFEEFYQLDNPARDRREGLGLGLSIVDRMGRLLGHPIELSSSVGKGSMFSVELPLVKSDFALPQTATTMPRAAETGILIVLIDDIPDVLESLRLTLEALGYDVLAAASEEQALQLLARNGQSPRLVISDYRLREGKRGTDAIKAVQDAVGAEIPAVIITGDTSPEELGEVEKSGIRVLHKPVRVKALAAEIVEILNT